VLRFPVCRAQKAYSFCPLSLQGDCTRSLTEAGSLKSHCRESRRSLSIPLSSTDGSGPEWVASRLHPDDLLHKLETQPLRRSNNEHIGLLPNRRTACLLGGLACAGSPNCQGAPIPSWQRFCQRAAPSLRAASPPMQGDCGGGRRKSRRGHELQEKQHRARSPARDVVHFPMGSTILMDFLWLVRSSTT